MREPPSGALATGDIAWAWLDPTVGREQSGRRPVVVVSSPGYNSTVMMLRIVVPVSRTDRGWPHHVRLAGDLGDVAGFAMTEQPRTASVQRLGPRAGQVDERCFAEIRRWLGDFLELG